MRCERAREIDLTAYLVEPRAPEWSKFRAHYVGCPDCSAELLRWTQLEGVVRGATPSSSHPDDETLLAFRRAPGSLELAQREVVSAHLIECAPCHDAVAAAVSPAVASLLSSLALPPILFESRPGLPVARTGSATRRGGAHEVEPLVLAPERVGLTLHSQPTLYWFLPERVSANIRIDIVDLDAGKSVLSKSLVGPFAAGVHGLRLSDTRVRLKPSHNYNWMLMLEGAGGPASGGIVRRIEPGASLRAALASATPEQQVRTLAGEGIWHDALDLLSRSIEPRPQNSALRRGRAQLFEQVGLDAAAARDRGGE